MTGFEPATFRTPCERATKLRHIPGKNFLSLLAKINYNIISCFSEGKLIINKNFEKITSIKDGQLTAYYFESKAVMMNI